MKVQAIAIAVLVAACICPAQTSPPGVCFAFNDPTFSVGYVLPLVTGGEMYLGFTAPFAATIEQVDVFGSALTAGMTVTGLVHQTIGGALGPYLGGGTGTLSTLGWLPIALGAPIPFVAGGTYALRLVPTSGSMVIVGDVAQTTPLPYAMFCGPTPPPLIPLCSTYPSFGTFGARIRFRALACGPTPLASAVQAGAGCGVFPLPTLAASVPPVLGTLFTFHVTTVALWGPIHLFWAHGPATTGIDLGFGGGCSTYLDMVSFLALANAGLEPFVTFNLTGVPTSTSVNIPNDPSLAGFVATAQAMIMVVNGVPTPFGNIVMTNALQLTLGY